ncbi:plasma-membrane proton-efflux P-type ATPase [Thermomonas flagellata]|uniref:plasma-membrane proton-efflux P-type ATPase n=1 Tax=Thermomonas flagellata TaxID=2888524 RepID=UPI001F03ECA3|nr:plasma-membrane proton-efflux P-type ATPase [Thermomonas flagellata]
MTAPAAPMPPPPAGDNPGLSAAEAAARLARDGANAIVEQTVPAWRQLLARFWGPVPWMLEAVIVLQLVLGRRLEAGVIAVLLVFNAVVAFLQQRRARDALALLKRQLQVRARVRRDGQWQEIAAAQLVAGDLIHLRAGDIVPADVALVDGVVALDQAALTGESLPVEASAGASAYTGSIVRQGEATGTVTATGARTRFGRTAELVRSASAPSHMQRTILAIVERLVLFDAVLALLVIGFALWHGLPWLDTLVFALMLLVASVPVALPATYTLATALSGRRLARHGVLVTRLTAVEEAAAIDVLVTDKTGTLTQNSLRYAGAQPLQADVDEAGLLRMAALASDEATQDPLDLAILDAARAQGALAALPPRQAFHPFDPATRRSEGEYAADGVRLRALKGAASVIGPLCGLDAAAQAALEQAEQRLAADGARVLAVAAARGDAPPRLLGVVGLADPLRADAADVIAQLRGLGLRVCMATGDAENTARAIAAQLGLGERACRVQPGAMPDPAGCDLYARVLPEDKHHIVTALQQAGHVVGMTGDGVNDAPALRQAEMGIAVASATDVAKAAAGVVLTDPGLGGVLRVVRTGRKVHRRMLTYTLNKVLRTLQIVLFLTLGLVVTGHFVISPLLIVLMLFANDFVSMSIAGDHAHPAPRPQRWQVGKLMGAAALLAVPSLLFAAVFYAWAARQGLDQAQLQTVVFLLLVLGNQAGIYVLRTDARLWRQRPSRWLLAATAGDLVVVGLLAGFGILMAAVPWPVLLALYLASAAFALLLDALKRPLFARFAIG